jgi:hypothetical protein
VDDPLHLALGLGPDGDHVAAAALGDDRLADHGRQVSGVEHGVQALADSILGRAQPLADGRQVG